MGLYAVNPQIAADVTYTGGYHINLGVGYIYTSQGYVEMFTWNSPGTIIAELESPRVSLAYAVKPTFSNLWIGAHYQMQVSPNLGSAFTNYGLPFTATNNSMVYTTVIRFNLIESIKRHLDSMCLIARRV